MEKRHNSPLLTLLKSAAIIGFPLALLFLYNYANLEVLVDGIPLKKISRHIVESDTSASALPPDIDLEPVFSESGTDSLGTNDSLAIADSLAAMDSLRQDTVPIENPAAAYPGYDGDSSDSGKTATRLRPRYIENTDSTGEKKQRILLIGDSQAGGIMYPLNDYCVENGHELVGVFTWFSASAYNFGYSKKVEEVIARFEPSLIVVVLGLNEMYARDTDRRLSAATKLKEKFGDIPYLWVGPANYMKDYGINKVYEQVAGSDRYVLSKDLELPRSSDNRHPNGKGYRIWMDFIAYFVQESPLYDFSFNPPKKTGNKIKGRIITANAGRDRGY